MTVATTASTVDTGKVVGRREVHYRSQADVLADAERLASGGYRQLGNWSLGQITSHLTAALQTGLDGAPAKMPGAVQLLARLFLKKGILRGPMKPGFRLPKKFAALLPNTSDDGQGIAAMRGMIDRWNAEPQRHPHGFFGRLTTDEWEQLMLRHAEMHMSFLIPHEG